MKNSSKKEITKVLTSYNLDYDDWNIQPFGNGLINSTWRLTNSNNDLILQKINREVFKHPEHIAENIKNLNDYLLKNQPDYFFISPIKTSLNKDFFYLQNSGYYRITKYLENSHTIDSVENATQAFEASRKFGELTRVLSDFPMEQLKITIENFHNLTLRFNEFKIAIKMGLNPRIREADTAIEFILDHKAIVDVYESILKNPLFKMRVTHHDTKISNVLFDQENKGLCVIDLDTVMPGYFISDVGDMIRTYISPSTEDDIDLTKIEVREDYFVAIWKGYISQMREELTIDEKKHFIYAGKFMIYMQAIRFLTDFLNNDKYYGSKFPNQNLNRANNQIRLLQCLMEKEVRLKTLLIN